MGVEDDVAKTKAQFEAQEKRRLSGGAATSAKPDSLPTALLPEVEEKTWNLRNSAFDQVDTDGDDMVSTTDLEASGLLSQEMSSALANIIEPEVEHGFSRNGFLQVLLQCHKVQ